MLFQVFQKHKYPLLIIFLLLAACYINSVNNDFVSDDTYAIRDARNISDISYFWSAPRFVFYSFVFFVVHKIFGLNPAAFRLVNIFVHLSCAWTAYFLLQRFFKKPVPFLTAAIFAAHPFLTEGVTWISGGLYAQYGLFLLLSLFFYIKSRGPDRFYFISLVVFLFSLFTSEKAVILPAILLAWEFSFGGFKRGWKGLIPFFVLSGLWVLMSLLRLGGRIDILSTQFGSAPKMINPFFQVPIAVTSYLQLIFWPSGLTLYHSEMIFSRAEYIIRLALFLLFIASIICCWRKKREIFFWLTFFIITLLPTLLPLGVSWVVAERYAYIGSLGVFAAAVMLLVKLFHQRNLRAASYVIFSLIIAACCVRTIIRNSDWRSQDSLWLAAARTSPNSPQNHNNLGDYYSRQGDFERAVSEFKRAIELQPQYADAHHNLANTYMYMGRREEAIETYQKAVRLNPGLWQSYQQLAVIYYFQKKYDAARESLLSAIKINPDEYNLHLNLATLYAEMGRHVEAQEEFRIVKALRDTNRKR